VLFGERFIERSERGRHFLGKELRVPGAKVAASVDLV